MSVQRKFRIILWDRTGSAGSRGVQKAVVFNAKTIGVEEFANDTGSAYWTLPNDHPQLAEFVPLERHYEIGRWSETRSRWEFVAAGLLNDYTTTEQETIFAGIDYSATLEQIFTPLPGMTIGSGTNLNPAISQTAISASIFKNGGINLNSSSVTVKNVVVTALATDTYVNNSVTTQTLVGPSVTLSFTVEWTGATTGFPAQPSFAFCVLASPPGVRDAGPPYAPGETGLPITSMIGAVEGALADSSTGVNRFKRTVSLELFGSELESQVNVGSTFTMKRQIESGSGTVPFNTVGNPLRTGVTYTFQIYGAVFRSSDSKYLLSSKGTISGSVTLGQADAETAQASITRLFDQATGTTTRLDYSALTTISSATQTHTTYTYGKPTLSAIADICDLQMGADTSKVVTFGIDRPTGGNSYNGNFKLNLNAGASTGVSLRYPENISKYSYSPGLSSVRNKITVIPSSQYLSGNSTQSPGVLSIGFEKSDTASIATYGLIPAVISKTGFLNEAEATKEAERLGRVYAAENTKRVTFTVNVDGLEIWNGWDLGQTIPVTIKHGLVNISATNFVISGVRWFGESNGREKLELELVLASAFRAGRS